MKNSRTILSTAINDPGIASNRTEIAILLFTSRKNFRNMVILIVIIGCTIECKKIFTCFQVF